MKIVVFSREFPEFCFRYANGMARYCDVLLILDRRNAEKLFDLSGVSKRPRLKIYLLDWTTLLSAARSTLAAFRAVVAFKPDYMHLQEIPDRVSPVVALLSKPFCKVIWTVHDPSEHSGRDSHRPADKRLLRALARRLADVIVAHGPTCRNDLARLNPKFAARLIQSEHGVLMTREEAPALSKPGTILFFGRMEEYKGLSVLTEAAEILSQRGVGFQLVVAGKGPELDKNAERLRRLTSVEVIRGVISYHVALKLFDDAALVVLPYKDATQSGVVAAAYGKFRPVIASRVGGIPDVVKHGETGLLVQPNDSVALADAIQQVLESKSLLEKMSQGARSMAEGQLNWDNITHDLVHNLNAVSR